MTIWPISALALVAANFVVMVLWMVITHGSVEALRTGRSRGPVSTLQPIVGLAVTLVYFTSGLFPLIPFDLEQPWSNALYLYVVNDIAAFCGVAVFHHMSWYFQPDSEPPSRSWLAMNYGTLGAFSALALLFPIVDPRPSLQMLGAY